MAAGFYSEYVDRDEQRYDKKQNSDPPAVDQYDGGEHHRAPHRDQGRGLDPARYAASLLVIEQVTPENPVAVQPAIAHRIAPGETVCRQQQKRSRRYQRNESPDESPSDERVCGDFQQFLFHVSFIFSIFSSCLRSIWFFFTKAHIFHLFFCTFSQTLYVYFVNYSHSFLLFLCKKDFLWIPGFQGMEHLFCKIQK